MMATAHTVATDWHLWLGFFGASIAIAFSPGARAIQSMASGLTHGLLRAYWSIVGQELGLLFQLALVAVGLGAIVAESILAFTVIKFVGVGYLLYLALRQWRATGRDFGEKTSATPPRAAQPVLFWPLRNRGRSSRSRASGGDDLEVCGSSGAERLSRRADVLSRRIEQQRHHVDHPVASQSFCTVAPRHQKLVGGGNDTEREQEYIASAQRRTRRQEVSDQLGESVKPSPPLLAGNGSPAEYLPRLDAGLTGMFLE
jgi:hypothetical protein